MAERPEDLNLPSTVVQRLIKEALPDGVNLSKEAKQTICRASSVFVLYLTACAVTHANKSKRKTLAINDIFSAIKDMEFDSFVQPLQDALKNRKVHEAQVAANKSANKKKNETQNAEEEAEDEDIEEVDVSGAGNEEDNEVVENDENEDSSKSNKKRKLDGKNDDIAENSNDNEDSS